MPPCQVPCCVWMAVVIAVVFWNCLAWNFQNLKECSSSPCRNGGVCKDSVGSYECQCVPGFTGDNCEVNINECDTAVCPADSECVDGIGTYQCVCKVGYPGMLLFEYLFHHFSGKNRLLLYPVSSDILMWMARSIWWDLHMGNLKIIYILSWLEIRWCLWYSGQWTWQPMNRGSVLFLFSKGSRLVLGPTQSGCQA